MRVQRGYQTGERTTPERWPLPFAVGHSVVFINFLFVSYAAESIRYLSASVVRSDTLITFCIVRLMKQLYTPRDCACGRKGHRFLSFDVGVRVLMLFHRVVLVFIRFTIAVNGPGIFEYLVRRSGMHTPRTRLLDSVRPIPSLTFAIFP